MFVNNLILQLSSGGFISNGYLLIAATDFERDQTNEKISGDSDKNTSMVLLRCGSDIGIRDGEWRISGFGSDEYEQNRNQAHASSQFLQISRFLL